MAIRTKQITLTAYGFKYSSPIHDSSNKTETELKLSNQLNMDSSDRDDRCRNIARWNRVVWN